MMNCQVCGTPLPSEATACPQCGTRTAAYYIDANASPYSPTAPAGSVPSSFAMNAPATQYGSNPYGTPPPPPSYSSDLYGTPPSLPPPRRSSAGRIMLIAVVAILLIVGSGSVYYTTVYHPNQLHAQATIQAQYAATTTAQTQIAQSQQSATAQANSTAAALAQVTATATSFQTLFLTGTDTTPTLVDPLSDNSKGLQWDEGQGCVFKGGAYHAINVQSSSFQICMEHKYTFGNFIYQVQMTISKAAMAASFTVLIPQDQTSTRFVSGKMASIALPSIRVEQTSRCSMDPVPPSSKDRIRQFCSPSLPKEAISPST